MNVLRGLDKHYDIVFSTLTERMMNEQVTIDDAKALLLSHKGKLEKKKDYSCITFTNSQFECS